MVGVVAALLDALPSGVQIVNPAMLGVSVADDTDAAAFFTLGAASSAEVDSYNKPGVPAVANNVPHCLSSIVCAGIALHGPTSESLAC